MLRRKPRWILVPTQSVGTRFSTKQVRHHVCEAPSGPLGQMVPDPFFWGYLSPADRCPPPQLARQDVASPGSAIGSKRNRGFDQALFQTRLQAKTELR
jgi:hypothetical protein